MFKYHTLLLRDKKGSQIGTINAIFLEFLFQKINRGIILFKNIIFATEKK